MRSRDRRQSSTRYHLVADDLSLVGYARQFWKTASTPWVIVLSPVDILYIPRVPTSAVVAVSVITSVLVYLTVMVVLASIVTIPVSNGASAIIWLMAVYEGNSRYRVLVI